MSKSVWQEEGAAGLAAVAPGCLQAQARWPGRRSGSFPPPCSCCDSVGVTASVLRLQLLCHSPLEGSSQEGEQDKRAPVNPAVAVEALLGPVCQ